MDESEETDIKEIRMNSKEKEGIIRKRKENKEKNEAETQKKKKD